MFIRILNPLKFVLFLITKGVRDEWYLGFFTFIYATSNHRIVKSVLNFNRYLGISIFFHTFALFRKTQGQQKVNIDKYVCVGYK